MYALADLRDRVPVPWREADNAVIACGYGSVVDLLTLMAELTPSIALFFGRIWG
jgi:hypothetical protein